MAWKRVRLSAGKYVYDKLFKSPDIVTQPFQACVHPNPDSCKICVYVSVYVYVCKGTQVGAQWGKHCIWSCITSRQPKVFRHTIIIWGWNRVSGSASEKHEQMSMTRVCGCSGGWLQSLQPPGQLPLNNAQKFPIGKVDQKPVWVEDNPHIKLKKSTWRNWQKRGGQSPYVGMLCSGLLHALCILQNVMRKPVETKEKLGVQSAPNVIALRPSGDALWPCVCSSDPRRGGRNMWRAQRHGLDLLQMRQNPAAVTLSIPKKKGLLWENKMETSHFSNFLAKNNFLGHRIAFYLEHGSAHWLTFSNPFVKTLRRYFCPERIRRQAHRIRRQHALWGHERSTDFMGFISSQDCALWISMGRKIKPKKLEKIYQITFGGLKTTTATSSNGGECIKYAVRTLIGGFMIESCPQKWNTTFSSTRQSFKKGDYCNAKNNRVIWGTQST